MTSAKHTQKKQQWLSSGLPESKERFVGVDSELKTSSVVVASETEREIVDMKCVKEGQNQRRKQKLKQRFECTCALRNVNSWLEKKKKLD